MSRQDVIFWYTQKWRQDREAANGGQYQDGEGGEGGIPNSDSTPGAESPERIPDVPNGE